ncbi:MAG: recombinase family protein, partial [Phycisphaerae bacterium]|nr:recombinase family protein [Phycisphaerae bacterium]
MIKTQKLNKTSCLTAWLLTRVSSEGQEEGEGPDAQLHSITLSAEREGYTPKNCKVVQETISGFTERIEDRPLLSKALDSAKAGDCFFWDKSDRMARDRMAKESIIRLMQRKGLRCFVGGLEFVLSDETQVAFLCMQGIFDHLAGRQLVARMVDGKASRRRKGFIIDSQASYGFDYIKNEDPALRTFLINKQEANVLREIISRVIDLNQSMNQIANWLNDSSIPPKSAKRWSSASLCYILRNPILTGKVMSGRNRYEKDSETGKTKRITTPRSEWKVFKELPDRIIDEDTFNRLQQILDSRIPAHRRKDKKPSGTMQSRNVKENDQRILRDLLFCNSCARYEGGTIRRSKMVPAQGASPKDAFYACYWRRTSDNKRKMADREKCRMPYIPASEVEGLAMEYVKRIFLDPKSVLESLLTDKSIQGELIAAEKQLASTESKLHKTNRRIEKTLDQMLDTESEQRKRSLDESLARYEKERDDLEAYKSGQMRDVERLHQMVGRADLLKDAADDLAGIRAVAEKVIDELNTEQKKRLLRIIANRAQFAISFLKGRAGYVLDESVAAGKYESRIEADADGENPIVNTYKEIGKAHFSFRPKSHVPKFSGWRLDLAGNIKPSEIIEGLAQFAREIRPKVFAKYAKDQEKHPHKSYKSYKTGPVDITAPDAG